MSDCTGKYCPMQFGYDHTKCVLGRDCEYYHDMATERVFELARWVAIGDHLIEDYGFNNKELTDYFNNLVDFRKEQERKEN